MRGEIHFFSGCCAKLTACGNCDGGGTLRAYLYGTLLYYTDDLSKGGSNTIIEVTLQGTVLLTLRSYYLLMALHACAL
jgi:hypothetical protein